VFINERCQIRASAGWRAVIYGGIALWHYAATDRTEEAYAMVSLVERSLALQKEIAVAFGCDVRTVRRDQRRYEDGGLSALGRPWGYPAGKARLPESRREAVERQKAEGKSNREIGSQIGISEKAVRKILKRLGYKKNVVEQLELPLGKSADSKLSGLADVTSGVSSQGAENAGESGEGGADSKLSGSGKNVTGYELSASLDSDPGDRRVDRLLACMGLLDDAAPVFREGDKVPGAGVLLTLPAIARSGVLETAGAVYGSIGPAFYGLRTTILALIMMALLRIRRPEGLKERSPEDLGRIIGLDRAPEVKTLRRKLTQLAGYGRAIEFGRELARRRMDRHGQAMGFLYVDGHVRVYYGKRRIPKTHVAQKRLCLPATTDYWVNDKLGEPLFVVTEEAHQGLVKMLPGVLEEVRGLIGTRRVTVVFDRGGWSPKLFAKLSQEGFDLMTYRKGRFRHLPRRRFVRCEAVIEGKKVSYLLADQRVRLKNGFKLRQVTVLREDGRQTAIITSREDLSDIEVAHRMFKRWTQENFFKYLLEEFALDALVDYSTEPGDPERLVPNPVRAKLDAEVKQARAELEHLLAQYGLAVTENPERLRRTVRGFKIANAGAGGRIESAREHLKNLRDRQKRVPARVPIQSITEGEVVKLAVERKHITNLIKMIAYQAEGELLRAVEPHYRRSADEGRTLVQNALAATGQIKVADRELCVILEPLSSAHRTKALAALCDTVNADAVCFPATKLRLRFEVKEAKSTGRNLENQPAQPSNRTF